MVTAHSEEIEYKLEVVGEEPAAVLDRIAGLEQIGVWSLTPPETHLIHDCYWDTPGRDLGQKRVSLRLRDIDGKLLITTKDAGLSHNGLFRRRELELPATLESWRQIRAAHANSGITLPEPETQSAAPRDWFRGAALEITQDRITDRRVRFALNDGERIGEIALDHTRYRFVDREVDFHEVEIERLAGSPEVVRLIGEEFMALVPGKLTPSTMGKYARGLRLGGRPYGRLSDEPTEG